MGYHDKSLTCSDCTRPFAYSAEEQGLSGELGYDQPVRCGICRSSRESTRRQFGRDPAATRTLTGLIPAFALVRPAELPL